MAEEEKEKTEEAPKKGKKKLIIIIGVVVVLLLAGVGAFFALGKKSGGEAGGEEGAEGGEDAHEGGEAVDLPPAVLPLDTFIVNLQVKGSFLKTTLQLEFSEPELPHDLEHQTPKIRDAIIRVLSAKAAPEILSTEGKEKMREEVRHAVNEALKSEDVTQVYITEFIIQ